MVDIPRTHRILNLMSCTWGDLRTCCGAFDDGMLIHVYIGDRRESVLCKTILRTQELKVDG